MDDQIRSWATLPTSSQFFWGPLATIAAQRTVSVDLHHSEFGSCPEHKCLKAKLLEERYNPGHIGWISRGALEGLTYELSSGRTACHPKRWFFSLLGICSQRLDGHLSEVFCKAWYRAGSHTGWPPRLHPMILWCITFEKKWPGKLSLFSFN